MAEAKAIKYWVLCFLDDCGPYGLAQEQRAMNGMPSYSEVVSFPSTSSLNWGDFLE